MHVGSERSNEQSVSATDDGVYVFVQGVNGVINNIMFLQES